MVFFVLWIGLLLLVVALVEFVYASAGIDVLLLTRVEGVALTANVYFYDVSFLSGAGYEFCAARTFHRYFMIIGMYILFHIFHLLF